MKLKFFYVSIVVIFIILVTSTVLAATGTANIKSNINEVEAGGTFIVTLQATSEDGINGIDTKFSYPSEKLELISEGLADSSKWSNIGATPDITVICNSTESIKKADIYVLKFKVKEDVSVGDILKIETTPILLDTDAQTDSEVSVEASKVEVKVIGDSQDDPTNPTGEEPMDDPTNPTGEEPMDDPTNPTGEEPMDDPTNPTGEEPMDNPTNPTGENPKDNPTDPTDEQSKDKTVKLDKNTNANTYKDVTQSNTMLPQTGENTFIVFGLIVIGIVLSIIFIKRYKKYNI